MSCEICKCKSEQILRCEREYDRLEMLYDELFELIDGVIRGDIDTDDIMLKETVRQHEVIRYGVHPTKLEDYGYSENVR